MRGMDTLDNFEIYIPREAKVMTVPMGSLRVSVQQRMGVQRSRSGHRSPNPSVIWISPVVIRERVRSLNMLDTSDMAKNNMASLVTQELKTISGPYHMAFVSSNCLALKVLGEFLPVQVSGNEKWRIPAQTTPLPHGTATRCPKDAIIIHHRRIYLSLKKPDRITGPRGNFVTPALPFKPQRKLVLESPAVSSKKMCHPVSPDATCYNTWRERAFLQRFGVTRFIQVTLSRLPSQYPMLLQSTSQQEPKGEALYTHHNTNEQDASNSNGSSKKTHNTNLKQEVEFLNVVKNDPVNQGHEQSPSKIFCPYPLSNKDIEEVGGCTGIKCSTPKKNGEEEDGTENGWDVKGEEDIEARSGMEAHVTDFNTVVIKGEDPTSDTDEESSDSPNVQRESQSNDSGMLLEMDDTEDGTVGGGGQIWGVEHPLVPAFSTPEQHYGFDFDQLAREEAIDRIRAKLRESEAALCSLRSLR